jgi:hypothetical protein
LKAPEYDCDNPSKALDTLWHVGGTMKDFLRDVLCVDDMDLFVMRRKSCGRSAPLLCLFEGRNSAEKVTEPFFWQFQCVCSRLTADNEHVGIHGVSDFSVDAWKDRWDDVEKLDRIRLALEKIVQSL